MKHLSAFVGVCVLFVFGACTMPPSADTSNPEPDVPDAVSGLPTVVDNGLCPPENQRPSWCADVASADYVFWGEVTGIEAVWNEWAAEGGYRSDDLSGCDYITYPAVHITMDVQRDYVSGLVGDVAFIIGGATVQTWGTYPGHPDWVDGTAIVPGQRLGAAVSLGPDGRLVLVRSRLFAETADGQLEFQATSCGPTTEYPMTEASIDAFVASCGDIAAPDLRDTAPTQLTAALCGRAAASMSVADCFVSADCGDGDFCGGDGTCQ